MTKRAVLIILVLLMLTGCGERENVDGMQVIEQFYFNNEADCNEIVKEAKAVLTKEYPSICKEEGDKFYVFAPGTDNMKSVSAHDKEYSKLIMLLTKKENEIIKRVDLDSQGINLLFSEGVLFLFLLRE